MENKKSREDDFPVFLFYVRFYGFTYKFHYKLELENQKLREVLRFYLGTREEAYCYKISLNVTTIKDKSFLFVFTNLCLMER